MNREYNLNEINEMSQRAFIEVFAGVFEDSPWVAQAAWQCAPFDSTQTLIETLFNAVRNADRDTQLKLLQTHPELGAKQPLTGYSAAEQAGAGLQREHDAQVALLADLNRRYRQKFGFPFILAVKGLTPDKIMENFHARLDNAPEDEFNECLGQVFRIAAFRLEDLLGEAGHIAGRR